MTVEAAVTRFVRAQTAPSSIVRREHPMAGAHSLANCWTIYTNEVPQTVLGTGKTALLAWRDAARNVMSNGQGNGPSGGSREGPR